MPREDLKVWRVRGILPAHNTKWRRCRGCYGVITLYVANQTAGLQQLSIVNRLLNIGLMGIRMPQVAK